MLALRKRSTFAPLDYYGPHIFALIWLGASLVPAYIHPNLDLDLTLTLGVLPVVMGFLVLRRKRMRQEYAKAKQFHLLQMLDLDAAGLRLVTSAGTTRSAWQVYSKFVEDPKSFILMTDGSQSFLPIPKGELMDGQIDELRALLSARLRSK